MPCVIAVYRFPDYILCSVASSTRTQCKSEVFAEHATLATDGRSVVVAR